MFVDPVLSRNSGCQPVRRLHDLRGFIVDRERGRFPSTCGKDPLRSTRNLAPPVESGDSAGLRLGDIFAHTDMNLIAKLPAVAGKKGITMKECFGKIYPNLSKVKLNEVLAGKVFSVRIASQGMMRKPPQFEADLAAWEECQRCDDYHSCFDFSNGKLAMRQAVARI